MLGKKKNLNMLKKWQMKKTMVSHNYLYFFLNLIRPNLFFSIFVSSMTKKYFENFEFNKTIF